jgi:hypothetical protein
MRIVRYRRAYFVGCFSFFAISFAGLLVIGFLTVAVAIPMVLIGLGVWAYVAAYRNSPSIEESTEEAVPQIHIARVSALEEASFEGGGCLGCRLAVMTAVNLQEPTYCADDPCGKLWAPSAIDR